MYHLLEEQLTLHFGKSHIAGTEIEWSHPANVAAFLDAVDATYAQADIERGTLEHTLDRTVADLIAANRGMRVALERLEREHAQLEEAQRITRVGHWELDLATRAFTCSEQALHIFGIDIDQFDGRYEMIAARVHPSDRAGVEEAFGVARAVDGVVQRAHRLVLPDGEIKWVEVHYTRELASDGTPRLVRGTVQDVTERQQAVLTIIDNEQRLHAIIDSSLDWVFVKDLEHRYLLANRAFAHAYDTTPDELVGRLYSEVFPPELIEGLAAEHLDGIRADNLKAFRGESVRHPSHRMLASGDEILVDEYKQPLRDADGNVVGVIGYVRDVTERHRMLEAADRNASRLADAENLAHLGSWEMDLTTGAVSWSDEMFRIFEIDPARSVASFGTVLDATHPDDLDVVNAGHARILEEHLPYRITHRLLMPDGRVKWVETIAAVEFSADGAPVLVHGALQDITEQVTSRQETERVGVELAQIVAASPLPIVLIDSRGAITIANAAAERVFGWESGQLIGEHVSVLSPDITPVPPGAPLMRGSEAGASFALGLVIDKTIAVLGRRADGTEFPAEFTVAEILLPEGDNGFVGIAIDRTEAKQAEEQIVRLQKLDALGTLTTGVAHDFNNLLTAILGGIEMWRIQPEQPRWPEMAEAAARRAEELVRHLLRFSRSEVSERVSTAPASILGNVMAMAGETIDRRISVTTDVDRELPDVFADGGQIEQVLLNLIVNARDALLTRFSDSGDEYRPSIQVAAAVGEHAGRRGVTFSVQDNGLGIPDEIRRRMFDPFFTTKSVGKGTGLGLSIVDGIISSHEGSVDVVSELGSGALVSFWLPLAAPPPPEPAVPTAARGSERTPEGSRPRVLVVDDEVMIGEIARTHLETAGFEVTLFSNGAEAIEVAGDDFDLAIVDLNMPPPDGWAVLAALRESHPGLAVVIASGFASASEVAARGGAALLHKPYDRKQLLAAARHFVTT